MLLCSCTGICCTGPSVVITHVGTSHADLSVGMILPPRTSTHPESAARETLGVQPTDQQSKLLRYDTCHQEITSLSLGMKIGRAKSHVRDRWLQTQTYREDTGRRAPEPAFLGGASAPSRLDEDAPAIVAVVAVVTAELSGLCKIPDT
jgi:hypothetical protein